MSERRPASPRGRLQAGVERGAARLRKAEKERKGILAEAAPLGVLGLVFVLPVVAGAYLGRWLDGLSPGYSVRWTVGFILLGVAVGAFNVWKYFQ